jgi:hypothetical protein
LPDAGEISFSVITGGKRELPHERARHHNFAGSDAAAELGKLASQPNNGVQRVAKDRVPRAYHNFFAIQLDPRGHLIEARGCVRPLWRTKDDRVLLGVVRESQGDVAGSVPARLDDLEGGMDAFKRVYDLLWRDLAL